MHHEILSIIIHEGFFVIGPKHEYFDSFLGERYEIFTVRQDQATNGALP